MLVTDADNIKVRRNLTALVEFSRVINSSLDLNFILSNILLTCMGKFFATKGIIALTIDGRLKVMSSKGLSTDIIDSFPQVKSAQSFVENSILNAYLGSVHLPLIQDICSSNQCIGVIILGEKLNKSEYSTDDKEFLKTILNIASTAIQNSLVINELKYVNRELDSRINRLSSLFELSKEFGMFTESSKVAKLLVYSVIGQFLVSKFAVVTFNEKEIEVLESKFPERELLAALRCCELGEIELSLSKEEISKNYKELDELNIELIVPMQLQGVTKGLILLGRRITNTGYSDSDLEFIYSVGSLAIISIENKRLFIEALEKQKMEEELDIARDIQRNLLPSVHPELNNFTIAASNVSSKQVGGDYYDIISLDKDTCCVAIADVSGKGVPAALLMANLQAFLKTTCRQGMQLSKATGLINDLISENTTDGKFITFFWGILDDREKTFHYVNAGHNPPYLIRGGKLHKLSAGGIILGVMKTIIEYNSETVRLQTDDVIIMYTDGVTEAKNKEDEEFSDEKLEELALQLAPRGPEEILAAIQKEVKLFSAGTMQSDDITLMVIKVK